MRIPRLKMKAALGLIGAASVLLWLQMVGLAVLLVGTLVLALMVVSLQGRGRVAGEIKSEEGRARRLTRAGFVGYSIAVALALVWLASVWAWQYFEHEGSKVGQAPARPADRANP